MVANEPLDDVSTAPDPTYGSSPLSIRCFHRQLEHVDTLQQLEFIFRSEIRDTDGRNRCLDIASPLRRAKDRLLIHENDAAATRFEREVDAAEVG